MTEIVWHDLECGSYAEDLPLWRELAAACEGPILDVGAGTGRVTLDLARAGHAVAALDSDAALLAELGRRAGSLPVTTVCADARSFTLGERFALVLVPMQTVQLLGGVADRLAFLRCAVAHLAPSGRVAIAIASELECFELTSGAAAPLPDLCERDGVVYCSQPTAIRAVDGGVVLERRREIVARDGERRVAGNEVRLDALSVERLEAEASRCGLRADPHRTISETADYVASEVVLLRA